jgi:hypothetical protein
MLLFPLGFHIFGYFGGRGGEGLYFLPPAKERSCLALFALGRSIQGLGTARKTEAKGTNGKRKRALHGAKRAFFSPICMGHLMHAQITLCKHVRTCDFIYQTGCKFSLSQAGEKEFKERSRRTYRTGLL